MAWAEDNSTSVSCQGGGGGGGGGGKKHGENILRKTLRADGMRENCLHSRSFETTKIREGQETEETNQNT